MDGDPIGSQHLAVANVMGLKVNARIRYFQGNSAELLAAENHLLVHTSLGFSQYTASSLKYCISPNVEVQFTLVGG